MKNIAKKYLYTSAGLFLLAHASLASAGGLSSTIKKTGDASNIENGTTGNFIGAVQNLIGYAAGLLYLIAVVFALYGGFQILTAGGDDGKVKKGKTTLINAALGLAAIFLASTIINWVISLFGNQGQIVS